jgi:hypothetical protein
MEMIGQFDNSANLFQGNCHLASRVDMHWVLAAKVESDVRIKGRKDGQLLFSGQTVGHVVGGVGISERIF